MRQKSVIKIRETPSFYFLCEKNMTEVTDQIRRERSHVLGDGGQIDAQVGVDWHKTTCWKYWRSLLFNADKTRLIITRFFHVQISTNLRSWLILLTLAAARVTTRKCISRKHYKKKIVWRWVLRKITWSWLKETNSLEICGFQRVNDHSTADFRHG